MADSKSDTDKQKIYLDTLETTGRITTARKEAGISPLVLSDWRRNNPQFHAAEQAVQESAVEALFDSLDTVLDVYPNPQQAKVFSDNLRWRLSKLRPDRFGDRLDVRSTHTIDLTDRFQRALDRLTVEALRPGYDLAPVIDHEPLGIPSLSDSQAPDCQSAHDAAATADGGANPLTKKDERAICARGEVPGGAPQNPGATGAPPPLETNRDGVPGKDYASPAEPLVNPPADPRLCLVHCGATCTCGASPPFIVDENGNTGWVIP